MWNVIAAFALDSIFGYQSANKLRDNLLALASRRANYYLGGSRAVALPLDSTAQNAVDYVDVELDSTNLAGFTVQARVDVRAGAATGIQPKIRNVTDGTDAGMGVACVATNADYSGTSQQQTITVTLAAGVKKYRLMGIPANTTDGTYCIGSMEIFASA